MTPDEKEECDRLCKAVIQEKDPVKFIELVTALNDFLERRKQELRPISDAKPR